MKNGINIILYPRSYNLRGVSTSHSVLGVTSAGKEVNVKLRIDDSAKKYDFAPSIREFASEDRKAKIPCVAVANNGPSDREGLLLFSQCQPDGKTDKGVDSYIARWAVVLCEDSDSPEPLYGIGRIHVNRVTKKTKLITHALSKLDTMKSEEGELLKKELAKPENYAFPSIIYHPDQMLSFELEVDSDYFCNQVGSAVDECCRSGIAGGFLIRALNNDGEVLPNSYKEKFQRFDGIKESYEDGYKTASNYLSSKDYMDLLGKDISQIDIIPISRIPSGTKTNQYYSAKSRFSLISRMYEQMVGVPKVCNIVIRPTYYSDVDRTLTSRVFALSSPLGHPMRTTRDGRLGLLLEGEAKNVTSRMLSGTGKLHPIGVTTDPRCLVRNYWVLGNEFVSIVEKDFQNLSSEEVKATKEAGLEQETFIENEGKPEDSNENDIRPEIESFKLPLIDSKILLLEHKILEGDDKADLIKDQQDIDLVIVDPIQEDSERDDVIEIHITEEQSNPADSFENLVDDNITELVSINPSEKNEIDFDPFDMGDDGEVEPNAEELIIDFSFSDEAEPIEGLESEAHTADILEDELKPDDEGEFEDDDDKSEEEGDSEGQTGMAAFFNF